MNLSDQENQEQELSSTEDEVDEHHSNPPKTTGRRRRSKCEKLGRPTGRKDRHSKVSTARGPKDRRVRLSAQTAIQFYDVQDRLGCDRPSEAIEWLMKKARPAIEALEESPSPPPTRTAAVAEQEDLHHHHHQGGVLACGYESQKQWSEDPSDGFSFTVENNSHFQNEFDSIWGSQSQQSFCLLLQSGSYGFCSPQGLEMSQEEVLSQGGTLQSSFYVPSMDQIPALCSSPVAGSYVSSDGLSGVFRGDNNNYPRTNYW